MKALPGIEVRRERDRGARVDERARRRHRPAEEERARGQQHGRRRRSRQALGCLLRRSPRGGRPSARRARPQAGSRPASVNWSPCSRSARPAALHAVEVAPRLRCVERAPLEEDVRRLRERRRLRAAPPRARSRGTRRRRRTPAGPRARPATSERRPRRGSRATTRAPSRDRARSRTSPRTSSCLRAASRRGGARPRS